MMTTTKKILSFVAVGVVSVLSLCETFAADANITASPDGKMVAFTRDNDLWVRSVEDSTETRLTFDGTDVILNGYASWVYYEEILGRQSRYKAFWWSPDSQKIGFYRFDNSGVSVFPIFSPFGSNGSLSLTRYPKAGQENPKVKIGMVDLSEGKTVWTQFEEDEDCYFGIPFWSPDSQSLFISKEPRRQNHLELYAVSASDGSRRMVYEEDYDTWLDWIEGMLFTDDGFYMARSFESGWEQIYFLSYDGHLERLTDGENWGINLLKADSSGLLFTAKRDSRIHTTLYRLDKKGRIIPLSDPEYDVFRVQFDENDEHYTAIASNARTPWFKMSGKTNKTDFDCEKKDTTLTDVPLPQLVQIENDGFSLYALMSLPKGFDPEKKYPVVMQLYGGPGTPYVRDSWSDRDASDRWCYENGIIYIVCDPRSSGENGRKGMDMAFRRMTVIELEDYIAWAKWLQALPYVEGSKIGVEGFSFGGTTTAMLVLRYPQYFRCGIAGGGVYDWTLYDSHYTERFMDTPTANPEGYKEASVISHVPAVFAEDNPCKPLPGALMLTHGTGDDNVHFQNTLQLTDALQKENYLFELMIYPDGKHGYRGYQGTHSRSNDRAFWTKWLLR